MAHKLAFPENSVTVRFSRRFFGVVAVATLGVAMAGILLARIVVGPLASWVDTAIDAPIRNLAEEHVSSSLTDAADRVSVLGSAGATALVVLVAGAIGFARKRDPRPGIVLLVAFVSAGFVTVAVKYGVHRSPASGPTARFSAGTFPSGHALFATTVYGALAILIAVPEGKRRAGRLVAAAALLLVPLTIGASRVYRLDHYASDVIGSFILGLLIVACAPALRSSLTRAVSQPPSRP